MSRQAEKQSKINTNELREKFIQIEFDYRLYDMDFDGVPLWQFLRWRVFHNINDNISNGNANFKFKYGDLKKEFYIKKYSKNYDITRMTKNKNILYVNFPKKAWKKNKYVSVNTDDVVDALKSKYSIAVLEDPFNQMFPQFSSAHFTPMHNIEITTFMDKYKNDAYKLRLDFEKKNSYFIKALKEKIRLSLKPFEKTFSVELPNSIIDEFVSEWFYYKKNKKSFEKLLKQSNCKAVMLFFTPTHSPYLLMTVANENNIPTIEMQHGVYSKFEPFFYQVIDQDRVYNHLPKHILTYGSDTIKCDLFPKNIKIQTFGNLFLKKRIAELKDIKKIDNEILVVSQFDIGIQLAKFVAALTDELKEYRFIYKLHPYETDEKYLEILNKQNITIVNDKENDIYFYQKRASFQIGVYSTALLEGLVFGLTTFVINSISQSERIKDLVYKIKGVYFVDKPKEVVSIIMDNKFVTVKNSDITHLWAECDENKLLEIVDRIIGDSKWK